MNALDTLEHLGRVEPMDPQLLDDTALHLAGLDADAIGAPPLRLVERRRRRGAPLRRLLAVAAAAVVVATGVVVLGQSPVTSPRHGALSELGRLALTADDQPTPSVPGPGQYMYTSSEEAYTSDTYDVAGGGYSVSVPEQRQIWIGTDGSGRIEETFGTPVFLSPADRANWVAAGSPALSFPPSDTTYGPNQLSDGPTDLTKLPTDPKALAALISSRHIEGGPPGPAEDFTQVGDLLRETDAPPALRAALFQVAKGIPGVEQLGTVTDHSGRPGVGVGFLVNGVRQELIFNPSDSSLIGEEDVVVEPSSNEPVGTIDDWVVYLASSVVDSDGAAPNTTPVTTPTPTGVTPQPAPGSSSISPSSISSSAAQ